MAKTSQQIEQEFLSDLKITSGKDLSEWLQILEKQGSKSRNDIIDWLKTNHDFGHVNASLLTSIFMNEGKAVYANEDGLLSDQFVNKEHLKPLYNKLIDSIITEIPETRVVIKKCTHH